MPTAAEIIADPQLRSQCEWVFLSSIPSDYFFAEDLVNVECDIPRLPFTGEVIDAGEIVFYYLLRQRFQIGPLPPGSSGEAQAIVLLFPGDPAEVVAFAELRGGFLLGAGDTFSGIITALVPLF